MEKVFEVVQNYGGVLDEYTQSKMKESLEKEREFLEQYFPSGTPVSKKSELKEVLISSFFESGRRFVDIANVEKFARQEEEIEVFNQLPEGLIKDIKYSFRYRNGKLRSYLYWRDIGDFFWGREYEKGYYDQFYEEVKHLMSNEDRLKEAFEPQFKKKWIYETREKMLKQFILDYPHEETLKQMVKEIEEAAENWLKRFEP